MTDFIEEVRELFAPEPDKNTALYGFIMQEEELNALLWRMAKKLLAVDEVCKLAIKLAEDGLGGERGESYSQCAREVLAAINSVEESQND